MANSTIILIIELLMTQASHFIADSSRATQSGRGSGRRRSSFSEYRQGFRRVPIFPQWLPTDPRRSFFGLSNSPQVQPCTGLLLWRSSTRCGLHYPLVPSFLNSLSDSGCCDKSLLKILKYFYLQYTSKIDIMRDIKSLPPLVYVCKQRLRGGRYKSLGLPTHQIMSKLIKLCLN